MGTPRRPASTAAARSSARAAAAAEQPHPSQNHVHGTSSSSSTPLRASGSVGPRKPQDRGALTARQNYESALLSAVRRQIESFEEKVGSQISTLRNQQQRDRQREAAFSRLEEKMCTLENMQPRFDQRLAELTGNFKGLSDEMQVQIRRVDLMDDRLWEWRHQLEEEFRQKYTDFEQSIQKVCSGVRVMASANEEGQKRLSQRVQALESELRERLSRHDDQKELDTFRGRMFALEGRCQSLEEQAALEVASSSVLSHSPVKGVDTMEEAANAALLGLLERRVGDVMGRMEQLHQDTREAHGKLAAQEEMHRTNRTLLEAAEERIRDLHNRLDRTDYDGRMDQLRQATQDEQRQRLDHHERLEILAKKIESQEQAHEELLHAQLRLRDNNSPISMQTGPDDLDAWQDRIGELEAHVGVLQTELEVVRNENVAPRVTNLVETLKEVMPKVVAHDKAIMLLQDDASKPQPNSGGFEEAIVGLRSEVQEQIRQLSQVAANSQEVASSVLGELQTFLGSLKACPPKGEEHSLSSLSTTGGDPRYDLNHQHMSQGRTVKFSSSIGSGAGQQAVFAATGERS